VWNGHPRILLGACSELARSKLRATCRYCSGNASYPAIVWHFLNSRRIPAVGEARRRPSRRRASVAASSELAELFGHSPRRITKTATCSEHAPSTVRGISERAPSTHVATDARRGRRGRGRRGSSSGGSRAA
jgi:hypothetical protein